MTGSLLIRWSAVRSRPGEPFQPPKCLSVKAPFRRRGYAIAQIIPLFRLPPRQVNG